MSKSWIVALFAICALIPSAWAKRAAPKAVKSVVYKGIEYRVKHWGSQRGTVEAYDTKAKKALWSKVIYRVHYNSKLERDVQDIFIKTMSLKGDLLYITNEKGAEYTLNIKTKAVKVIKGKASFGSKSPSSSCNTLSSDGGVGSGFAMVMLCLLLFGTRRQRA